jgi:fluoride ion exporter CrcB/FEX
MSKHSIFLTLQKNILLACFALACTVVFFSISHISQQSPGFATTGTCSGLTTFREHKCDAGHRPASAESHYGAW